MWLLVSISQPDTRYPILGDHKYVAGRQNCDIVIPDASVSRKQAVFTMAHYESNVVKSFIIPTLTLEDMSKFGTFVNGKAVKNPGGNTVTLKHNDEIKFGGTASSTFRAVYEPFLATTSCLEKAPKKSLHKVMCLLGGHLVRDWRPNCDILIMSKINVTIKVICAINNQKHIVVPQYLDDLYAYLMGKRNKPDPRNYLPEVVDQEVPPGVSFHPDIRRLTLLEGMKFYFLSPVQFNKTNLAVSTAGGQPILLEDGTEEEAETMVEDRTVVVSVSRDLLSTLSPSCHKFFKLVYLVLKRHNLRMITDPEIGWAILTCNIEDFCNPHTAVTPGMLASMASQSMSQALEIGTTQNTQVTDIRPQNRLATSIQVQDKDLERDKKPIDKEVKVEIPSQGTEQGGDVKKSDQYIKPEVFSGQVDQEKVKTASGRVMIDECDVKESVAVEENLKSPNGAKKQNIPDKDSEITAQNSAVTRKQKIAKDADKSDKVVSVFALQRAKKNAPSRITNLDNSEDEELSSTSRKAPKRKAAFASDDDEEEDTTGKNGRIKQNKRSLGNTDMDFDFLDDEVDGIEDGGDPARITAESNDVIISESPERKLPVLEESPESVGRVSDTSPPRRKQNQNTVISADGWLMAKDKSTAEDNKEIKPDIDLLRDSEGKVLRNLCKVETKDLVAKPTTSQVKPTAHPKPAGQKNFKKFRKTQHVGAGKLPTIIGGRDLAVYLGSRHKDIQDLFSNGLAEENERQEEEKRSKDLFDWEDRPKKAPIKRKR